MQRSIGERLWAITIWTLVGFFVVNLLAMIGSVVVNSFGTRWFHIRRSPCNRAKKIPGIASR